MRILAGTVIALAKLSTLLSFFIAEALRHDTDTLQQFVKRAELTLPLLAARCMAERHSAVSTK